MKRTTRAAAPHSLPSRFSSPLSAPRASKLPAPASEPLVTLNDAPVAVRHHNQIAAAFHPELDDDNRLYEAFLAAFEARLLNQPIDGARAARRPQPFHKRLVHQPIERAGLIVAFDLPNASIRIRELTGAGASSKKSTMSHSTVPGAQHMNGMEATCFV